MSLEDGYKLVQQMNNELLRLIHIRTTPNCTICCVIRMKDLPSKNINHPKLIFNLRLY